MVYRYGFLTLPVGVEPRLSTEVLTVATLACLAVYNAVSGLVPPRLCAEVLLALVIALLHDYVYYKSARKQGGIPTVDASACIALLLFGYEKLPDVIAEIVATALIAAMHFARVYMSKGKKSLNLNSVSINF